MPAAVTPSGARALLDEIRRLPMHKFLVDDVEGVPGTGFGASRLRSAVIGVTTVIYVEDVDGAGWAGGSLSHARG